jgi:transposase
MSDKVKKSYTREFKLEAIQLYETSGKTLAEVESELGIAPTLLSKWRRQFAQAGQAAFPGKGNLTASEAELAQLRRENLILRQERDILKKAVGLFSNPSR